MLQNTIVRNTAIVTLLAIILALAGYFLFSASEVLAVAAPTVDLKANGEDGTTIVEGDTVTLSWTTTNNPTNCKALGGWSGFKDVDGGSEVVGPLTQRTRYGIRCQNSAGKGVDSFWVEVVPDDPGEDGVTLLFSQPCTSGDCTQHRLSVSCLGLPARELDVWEHDLATSTPNGAILLTIGGQGRGHYGSSGGERGATRQALIDGGYEVFAVDWAPEATGWFSNGDGWKDSLCGYGLVAEWIHDNIADDPSAMCAAGNSGGAWQIMYGIEFYDAGNLFDMVVPSSGPTFSRVDDYCFNPNYPLRSGGGHRAVNDIMGWTGNGDYCKSDDAPQHIIDEADRTSILSDLESRTLHYPNTKVHLVYSENDNSGLRAAEYMNEVTSEKVLHELPGSTHQIDNSPEGAALIRDLLLTECVDTSS